MSQYEKNHQIEEIENCKNYINEEIKEKGLDQYNQIQIDFSGLYEIDIAQAASTELNFITEKGDGQGVLWLVKEESLVNIEKEAAMDIEDSYNVSLVNNQRCNFDNGVFTNLKDAKEWAEGRGKNYIAYFKKNYDPELNISEEEFKIEY